MSDDKSFGEERKEEVTGALPMYARFTDVQGNLWCKLRLSPDNEFLDMGCALLARLELDVQLWLAEQCAYPVGSIRAKLLARREMLIAERKEQEKADAWKHPPGRGDTD